MFIREVMTTDAECINPGATIQHAADRMRALDVGSLPVCDNDRLAGMITDRDITIRATAEGRDPTSTKVGEVMTAHMVYCFADDDISEAARLMEENQIRRLPVLNKDKRLVGIISLGDLAVKAGEEGHAEEALEEVSEPAMPRR